MELETLYVKEESFHNLFLPKLIILIPILVINVVNFDTKL